MGNLPEWPHRCTSNSFTLMAVIAWLIYTLFGCGLMITSLISCSLPTPSALMLSLVKCVVFCHFASSHHQAHVITRICLTLFPREHSSKCGFPVTNTRNWAKVVWIKNAPSCLGCVFRDVGFCCARLCICVLLLLLSSSLLSCYLSHKFADFQLFDGLVSGCSQQHFWCTDEYFYCTLVRYVRNASCTGVVVCGGWRCQMTTQLTIGRT